MRRWKPELSVGGDLRQKIAQNKQRERKALANVSKVDDAPFYDHLSKLIEQARLDDAYEALESVLCNSKERNRPNTICDWAICYNVRLAMRYTQYRGKAKVSMSGCCTFACINLKKLALWLDKKTRSSFLFSVLEAFVCGPFFI